MNFSAGSQKNHLSKNQSESLIISKDIHVNEYKADLELQEPLSQRPEKLLEIVSSSETDHSNTITDHGTSDRNTGSDLINTISAEKPKGQIAFRSLLKENTIAEKTGEQPKLIEKTIKPNDSLSKIAIETNGLANDTVIDLIHMANPAVQSVDRIYAGQTILLPKIKKENLISRDESGRYRIHYASFYKSDDASNCVEELKDNGQKIVMTKTYQQENTVYRVYYGIFASYEEAKQEINNLQLDYFGSPL